MDGFTNLFSSGLPAVFLSINQISRFKLELPNDDVSRVSISLGMSIGFNPLWVLGYNFKERSATDGYDRFCPHPSISVIELASYYTRTNHP